MILLRSEEKIALGKDLRLFIPAGWNGVDKTKPTDELTVVRLHKHISEKIRGLLDTPSRKWKIPRISGLSLSRNKPSDSFGLTGEGEDFEGVVLGVSNLILELGNRLKACGSPVCKKPFVATGRQEYCSIACSLRKWDKRRAT
jgi:hypothetical protein